MYHFLLVAHMSHQEEIFLSLTLIIYYILNILNTVNDMAYIYIYILELGDEGNDGHMGIEPLTQSQQPFATKANEDVT